MDSIFNLQFHWLSTLRISLLLSCYHARVSKEKGVTDKTIAKTKTHIYNREVSFCSTIAGKNFENYFGYILLVSSLMFRLR